MKRRALAAGFGLSILLTGCAPAIVRSANNGRTEEVRKLLAEGADPNAVPSAGTLCCGSALFVAARDGNLEMAKLLLDKGADPNFENFEILRPIKGMYKLTALMAAAVSGHDAIAELLLKKGARVDAATPDGETALRLAQFQGHDSTARLLQEWHDKANPAASPVAPPKPEYQSTAAPQPEAPPASGAKPWYEK